MTDATKSDMAAFGASDAACYAYPDDTDVAKAQRAAFCAGAAWSAAEIERLRSALKPFTAIPIWRDAYPDGPDVISVGSERYPFTIDDVHAARDALEQSADR